MKKLTLAIIAMVTALCSFAAEDEQPIITFKTNIYDTYGASNSFTIRLGSKEKAWFDYDCGAGKNEVEVEPATFDTEASAIKATPISCNVNKDGIVKIYGDASLIDYFDGEGAYIDWIEFGDCVNLEIIDLQHNELKRLDLSKYDKLSAIYLTDNTFTPETPLVIGENHPNLTILEIDIIDYIDPSFDITTYPNLVSFDAYHNMSLYHLDPSKCPYLQRISVDCCPLTSLDVSKNPNLRVLNIEDSGITSIDLTNNTKLTQLYASHNSGSINTTAKITSIDLSKNTELTYLTLSGNRLTEIDLSNNSKLDNLNLASNLLTHIDVSNLTNLVNFDIKNNYFTFATLPDPDPAWYDFQYEQHPIALDKSYAEGAELNLADKVLRPGTTTTCELYAYSAASNTSTKLDATYYDYADGKVTLKKASSDSLYLSFANSAFVGVPLATKRFMVKKADEFGKPSEIIKFGTIVGDGTQINMSAGLLGASETTPKKFYVNPGDGNLVEITVTTESLADKANAVFTKKSSGNVQILIPEGEVLTSFGLDNLYLTTIDLQKATELEHLRLTNSELYDINLKYNRALRSLVLTGNHFGSLTLEGINGVSAKNMLSDINLSNNELTNIVLNDTRAINNLNLSHNKIAVFDYKEFEYIKNFDISYNELTSINTAYMYSADRVVVSNNKLDDIILPDQNGMKYLDLSNNYFTLANLPQAPAETIEYHYAPQAPIVMPVKAPGANLSDQNYVVDGVGTNYKWLTTDNTVLTEGVDYRLTNGATAFLTPAVGKKVYCEMSNPAFPEFTGANVLRTTVMEAAAMPTNLIASFTTPTGGQEVSLSLTSDKEGTAVYIDWSGNGSSVEQYVLGTSYRRFSAKTVAGATAKVYTYTTDEHITVFSISGATMSSFDGSELADASAIMIYNAGLSHVTLPENTDKLRELSLTGNSFTNSNDIAKYSNLVVLDIAGNKFENFDASPFGKLQQLYIGNNSLTDIKFGNNGSLWLCYAAGNQLSSIDFAGAPNIEQLDLGHNLFDKIDLSQLRRLRTLSLVANSFTFATLPAALDANGSDIYAVYNYGGQKALDVECIDGKVDLSSQENAAGKTTTYRWFVGVPEIDTEGNMNGEELIDGEEYTIADGVTTFLITYNGVMCVMTNPAFPNLYLYTNLLNVQSGIEDVSADNNAEAIYYTLQGIRVTNPQPGTVYIVRKGDKVSKVLYR